VPRRHDGPIRHPPTPPPLTPRTHLQRLGWQPVWLLLGLSLLLHLVVGDTASLGLHALYAGVVGLCMGVERARPGWGLGLFYAALAPFGVWLAERGGPAWTLTPDLAGYSAALILPGVAAAVRFGRWGMLIFVAYALLLGSLFLPVAGSQLPGIVWNVLLTLGLGWQFAWLLDQADRAVAELHCSALLDPLTRLGNRRAFDQALDDAWATQPPNFGVALLDLDHLKQVNDLRGHPAGDRLLRQFAGALRGELPPDAQVFRLGGDEYAVLCGAEELGAVRAACRRAVARVRTGDFPEAGASLGSAAAAEADSLGVLVRLADERLYAEKRRKGQRRVAGR